MSQHQSHLLDFDRLLDRSPLTAPPDLCLSDTLALMSRQQDACALSDDEAIANHPEASERSSQQNSSASSFVLVLENKTLVGILTERDLVRLTAAGTDLEAVTLGDVMTRSLVTLSETENPDVFSTLALMRQHRIRHLPVLDDRGSVTGVITAETIRRSLKPAGLLKLRRVGEVMRSEVVRAPERASVRELAGLMAEHRVSCVALVRSLNAVNTGNADRTRTEATNSGAEVVPVGIVTERDIVQYLHLGLNLANTQAGEVMSAPLFPIAPDDTLWTAQQLMEQRRVRRLVVTGDRGELVGILTQTNLLDTLNPIVMARELHEFQQVFEVQAADLVRTNRQLEAEIVERKRLESLLQAANVDLTARVETKTVELTRAALMIQTEVQERRRADRARASSDVVRQAVFDGALDAMLVADDNGQWVEANAAAGQLFGLEPRELVGRSMADFFNVSGESVEDVLTFFNSGDRVCHAHLRRADGTLREIEYTAIAHVIPRRHLAILRDISDRVRAAAEARQQAQQARLFADLALKIRQSLELEDILRTTVSEVQALLEADRVAIVRIEPEHVEPEGTVGIAIEETVCPEYPSLKGKIARLLATEGNPGSCRCSTAAEIDESPCSLAFSSPTAARASLEMPILLPERCWGVLLVQQCDRDRQWQQQEIELLQHLGDQLAIAITQAQFLDRLEEEVSRRTTALSRTNQQLEVEIRQRKRTERELREHREMLAGILENADEAIISVDERHIVQMFNQGAERIFGYRTSEIIGQPLDVLLPEASRDRHRKHVSDFGTDDIVSRKMGERSSNVAGRRKNGEQFPAEASISKVTLGHSAIYTAILKDISEREAIARVKDEFISVVSHELRTPLTSVHGSLKLLSSGRLGTLSEQGESLLRIAANNTERLTRLINDVLDLERIESGRIVTNKQCRDAANLVTQATEAMQAMALAAEISLSVSFDGADTVYADPDQMLQTLTNLIGNALKFSPAGSTVWVEVRDRADDVLFLVRDRGRGIPPDRLESIFERFQQVDVSDSRQKGGTGLGLAICSQIVQRHQGRIWVESELDRGSAFYFTIPKPIDPVRESLAS